MEKSLPGEIGITRPTRSAPSEERPVLRAVGPTSRVGTLLDRVSRQLGHRWRQLEWVARREGVGGIAYRARAKLADTVRPTARRWPVRTEDVLAADLMAAAESEADPMWRMPLYDPYKDLLKSDVADMLNAAEGPFGGAITAALFLKEFAPDKAKWAHFDIFCWNGSPKPGRPKGAEAVSLRATWKVLKDRYGG